MNSHLRPHRGPVVAPRRYPDPHTACSWLRELLWTVKQKKCFCQACGGVPTVTPKAVLGNDLRPIGQEVASDHRSHFLQDTHTHAVTHSRPPARTIYAMLTLVPPSAQDGYMRHDGAAVRRSQFISSWQSCSVSVTCHLSGLLSSRVAPTDSPTVLSYYSSPCGATAAVFHILQHLMKVSVERPAPTGLPTFAIYTQIILFVTQRSHCIVRQLTSPAVTSTSAPLPMQCLYILGVIVPTRSEY